MPNAVGRIVLDIRSCYACVSSTTINGSTQDNSLSLFAKEQELNFCLALTMQTGSSSPVLNLRFRQVCQEKSATQQVEPERTTGTCPNSNRVSPVCCFPMGAVSSNVEPAVAPELPPSSPTTTIAVGKKKPSQKKQGRKMCWKNGNKKPQVTATLTPATAKCNYQELPPPSPPPLPKPCCPSPACSPVDPNPPLTVCNQPCPPRPVFRLIVTPYSDPCETDNNSHRKHFSLCPLRVRCRSDNSLHRRSGPGSSHGLSPQSAKGQSASSKSFCSRCNDPEVIGNRCGGASFAIGDVPRAIPVAMSSDGDTDMDTDSPASCRRCKRKPMSTSGRNFLQAQRGIPTNAQATSSDDDQVEPPRRRSIPSIDFSTPSASTGEQAPTTSKYLLQYTFGDTCKLKAILADSSGSSSPELTERGSRLTSGPRFRSAPEISTTSRDIDGDHHKRADLCSITSLGVARGGVRRNSCIAGVNVDRSEWDSENSDAGSFDYSPVELTPPVSPNLDASGRDQDFMDDQNARRKSAWRTLKSALTWSPFVQTFKKQKYPWVQLAGHRGDFKSGPEPGTILKKLTSQEFRCFRLLMNDELKTFVPSLVSLLRADDGTEYLQLQDLLYEFINPSVMDCKIGIRTYLEEELSKANDQGSLRKDMYEKMVLIDPKAPTEEEHRQKAITKPRYMIWRETTSSSHMLGFRIDGIRKSDGTANKDFKTTKTKEQVLQVIHNFLRGYPDAASKYLNRLLAIKEALKHSRFFTDHEIIGSSLLFVHDHSSANVWMIDFAKSLPLPSGVEIDHEKEWQVGNHEDGYLFGLNNLICIMAQLSSSGQFHPIS